MTSLLSAGRALANRLRNRSQRTPAAAPYGLVGDFKTWQDAVSASGGYDDKVILDRTTASLMKVKRGEAVYERDSVTFDAVEYAWPTLAGLMFVAAQDQGRLNVLDFGGSLGSSYFQNRLLLDKLPSVRWNVVEQASHVRAGREHFEDSSLHFYYSIDECIAESQPNVVLLSSVLQYVERPLELLAQVERLSSSYVIIDRTSFWTGPDDRLCIQTVPPSIYPASYPIWIFSKSSFTQRILRQWEIVAEFKSLDHLSSPVDATWSGMILRRLARST